MTGKMKKDERQRLLDRIATLEREKVDVIAARGTEKLRFQEALRDSRKEMNKHLLAGMLLMRETIRTKLKQASDSRTGAIALPHTNVGIKALQPFIEVGLMKLSPEGLELYCESVLRRIGEEKAEDWRSHIRRELQRPDPARYGG